MLITDHCKSRIERRLQGIVTVREVQECTEGMRPKIGETWVLVKKLTEHKSIADTSGKWVNGNTVWAVVKRRRESDAGAVVTILLRRWAQGRKAGTNSP